MPFQLNKVFHVSLVFGADTVLLMTDVLVTLEGTSIQTEAHMQKNSSRKRISLAAFRECTYTITYYVHVQ